MGWGSSGSGSEGVPYFPHLFILCMHYGTHSGFLPVCLKLVKREVL